MKKTSGKWDKSEKPIYFFACANYIAANLEKYVSVLKKKIELNMLIELFSISERVMERVFEIGKNIMIDSGVFSIASKFAREMNLTHDEALKVKLSDLKNGEEIFKKYIEVAKKYEGRFWGIVEIDLGGQEEKRKMRRRIEAEGIVPIPVFHALNDDLEYLDELMEEYDRICLGSVVYADTDTREKILSFMKNYLWEKGKDVWVHCLGIGPSRSIFLNFLHSFDARSYINQVASGKNLVKLFDKTYHYDVTYTYNFIEGNYSEMVTFLVLNYSSIDFKNIYKLVEGI